MHEIQKSLLSAIQERGIKYLPPLRKLADMAGKQLSAQQVKHHLGQLEKKGFIIINKKTKEIKTPASVFSDKKISSIVSLPIYGTANCGPASNFAENEIEGYLKISSSLLISKNADNLFVVKASGDSMNQASIKNKNIEDGDFLIVDSKKNRPEGRGEIVLSIIDGMANVKKIFLEDNHYVLVSDSTKEFPPIFIDSSTDYVLNGTIVDVLKKPKQK